MSIGSENFEKLQTTPPTITYMRVLHTIPSYHAIFNLVWALNCLNFREFKFSREQNFARTNSRNLRKKTLNSRNLQIIVIREIKFPRNSFFSCSEICEI